MKKKIVIISLIVVFVLILLIPVPMHYKDGGSIEYKAVLYSVTRYHKLNTNSAVGYDDGWRIQILGINIYDKTNTYVDVAHVISIKTNSKIINANTGSFCYKKGVCIDDVDFQYYNYDVLTSYYGNKLYIDNLDGNIKSIQLFDYGIKEFINIDVKYTDEYIITPSISGPYIFKINATYEGKNIEYYFMTKINEISGEDIDLKLSIKDKSLTSDGLTMVMDNASSRNLSYGNPWHMEKYEDGYFVTMEELNVISFTLPAYGLSKGELKEINMNWEYRYGKLSKGKYRIVKEFDYEENEKYISFDKYLEFEL